MGSYAPYLIALLALAACKPCEDDVSISEDTVGTCHEGPDASFQDPSYEVFFNREPEGATASTRNTGVGGTSFACSAHVKPCGTDEFSSSLRDPYVQAAFGDDHAIVGDTKQKALFILQRSDKKQIWFGTLCEGADCPPVAVPLLRARNAALRFIEQQPKCEL